MSEFVYIIFNPCIYPVILFCASSAEVRRRMLLLQDLGKLTGEYVIITYGMTSGKEVKVHISQRHFSALLTILNAVKRDNLIY